MTEPERSTRTLRTILAGDVVNYSRHMGAAEEETLAALHQHRAVVDGLIATRGGRIFTTAGDSVLAEFESPVEAVRCALEIQESIGSLHRSASVVRPLQFRIGVHTGDILRSGDNLLGDAVNVAARLESIAEPGSVFVSREVKDYIEARLALQFRFHGNESLKNIARPVGTYEVSATPVPRSRVLLKKLRRRRGAIALLVGLLVLAYLFVAYDGLGLIRTGIGVRVLPTGTMLTVEPPPGSLAPGRKVLVDDGSCPSGQVKEASGGNQTLGLPRTYRCVPRP